MDVLGQQEPGKGRDHNVVACRPRERAGVVSLPEGRLMGWRVQGGWEGLKMLRMFARQVMPVIGRRKDRTCRWSPSRAGSTPNYSSIYSKIIYELVGAQVQWVTQQKALQWARGGERNTCEGSCG